MSNNMYAPDPAKCPLHHKYLMTLMHAHSRQTLLCAPRWRNMKDGRIEIQRSSAGQKYDYNTAEPHFDDSIQQPK